MEVNGRYYAAIGKWVVEIPRFAIEGTGDIPVNDVERGKRVEREARARLIEVLGPIGTPDSCRFLDSKPKGEPTHSEGDIKIWKI